MLVSFAHTLIILLARTALCGPGLFWTGRLSLILDEEYIFLNSLCFVRRDRNAELQRVLEYRLLHCERHAVEMGEQHTEQIERIAYWECDAGWLVKLEAIEKLC